MIGRPDEGSLPPRFAPRFLRENAVRCESDALYRASRIPRPNRSSARGPFLPSPRGCLGMLDDSSARWFIIAFVALLLSPGAAGAPPSPNLESAASTDGQEITGFAMDPTGQYVTAVVTVDPVKLLPLPGQSAHRDIYTCDFGAVTSVNRGVGCTGLKHGSGYSSTSTTAAQAVDYIFDSQFGGRFAVAGPGTTISMWAGLESNPRWETNTSPGSAAVNISISPNAARVVAGVVPTSINSPGTIEVYAGGAGVAGQGTLWTWPLGDSRPTALEYTRTGKFLAVGTTTGVIFLNPAAGRPSFVTDTHPVDTGAAVRHLAVARDGEAVAVATARGVYFIPMFTNGTPQDLRWSRDLAGGAQRVALSLDGERFAAASGTKIYFYRQLHTSNVAEQAGEPYDTGSIVGDLAYDAKGSMLVAVAGSRVYGFGPDDSSPAWSFDATTSSRGGLDAPLRKVAISDGAERIVVAGKSSFMPYRTTATATGVFLDAERAEVKPGETSRFAFTVTNTGSIADNYTFLANFPVGWNGAGPGSISLGPDKSATLNVTLDVPVGQSPDIYGVFVQVRSQYLMDHGASNAIVATPRHNFTIPRSVVLNVTTLEERIPQLRAGGEQTVPVTIRNRGNAEGVVNLTVEQVLTRGSSWNIHFTTPQIRIPGGGEKIVNMVITAPNDAASGDRNDITIIAREGPIGQIANSEARRVVYVYVDPKFGAEVSAPNSTYEFAPGELRSILVKVLNTGNTDDVYNVTTTVTPSGVINDWRVSLDKTNVSVPRGESRTITVGVRPGVSDPREASLVVKAISKGSGESESSATTMSLLPKSLTTTPEKSFVPAPGVGVLLAMVGLAAIFARRGGPRE